VDLAQRLADDYRVSDDQKKSLIDALPELLERGTTRHPLLIAISLARMINQASGGAVISPWEVEHLDESWLDGFRFVNDELVSAAGSRQKVQAAKNRWLSQHPTYGK
jgi:hypothetical protein